MEYANLLVEREDGVCLVTINRPSALNALNAATMEEMASVFGQLTADGEVRAVVVTGAGERAFVAGADLSELQALQSAAQAEALSRRGQRLFADIESLPQPVIAAVNGYALGGGCELALACDFRIASDASRFSMPEVGLGIIPGWGGTCRLPLTVGIGPAKRLIVAGETIDAPEALRVGLVDRVVPAGELLGAAKEWARRLAERSPAAMAAAKRAIAQSAGAGLEAGYALETALFASVCTGPDREEGISAFREKRRPRFGGSWRKGPS